MIYNDPQTGKQVVIRDPSDLLINLSRHVLQLTTKQNPEFVEGTICYPTQKGADYIVSISENEFVAYVLTERDIEADVIGFSIGWLKSDTTAVYVGFHKSMPEDKIKLAIEQLIAIF